LRGWDESCPTDYPGVVFRADDRRFDIDLLGGLSPRAMVGGGAAKYVQPQSG
jgi:hypothetical protein